MYIFLSSNSIQPIFAEKFFNCTKLVTMYRLDRSAFVVQNMESAAHQRSYWLAKNPQERLAASWYLTCAAWNLDVEKEHRLDRNCFSIRHKSENAKKHL